MKIKSVLLAAVLTTLTAVSLPSAAYQWNTSVSPEGNTIISMVSDDGQVIETHTFPTGEVGDAITPEPPVLEAVEEPAPATEVVEPVVSVTPTAPEPSVTDVVVDVVPVVSEEGSKVDEIKSVLAQAEEKFLEFKAAFTAFVSDRWHKANHGTVGDTAGGQEDEPVEPTIEPSTTTVSDAPVIETVAPPVEPEPSPGE